MSSNLLKQKDINKLTAKAVLRSPVGVDFGWIRWAVSYAYTLVTENKQTYRDRDAIIINKALDLYMDCCMYEDYKRRAVLADKGEIL